MYFFKTLRHCRNVGRACMPRGIDGRRRAASSTEPTTFFLLFRRRTGKLLNPSLTLINMAFSCTVVSLVIYFWRCHYCSNKIIVITT